MPGGNRRGKNPSRKFCELKHNKKVVARRLCKIQRTFDGHCVVKSIAPLFIYPRTLPLGLKKMQQTQLSVGVLYCQIIFSLLA